MFSSVKYLTISNSRHPWEHSEDGNKVFEIIFKILIAISWVEMKPCKYPSGISEEEEAEDDTARQSWGTEPRDSSSGARTGLAAAAALS